MALPTSGQISMQQINAEFGRGTNLGAYRNTLYYNSIGQSFLFPATNLSFSLFYGTYANDPTGGGGGGGDGGGDGAP